MTLIQILFYFFIFMAGAAALAILFSKNVFESAIFLLLCLLSIAALYVLSFAEFLAVTQILIYAGGITVLIIFGIMLTAKISGKPLIVDNKHIISGGVAAVSFFILILRYLPDLSRAGTTLEPKNISATGLELFSTYTLPFEVAGLLLLVALIGAAVITSQLKSKA